MSGGAQLARAERTGVLLACGRRKGTKERDALVFFGRRKCRSQTLADAARNMSTRSIWQMAKRKSVLRNWCVFRSGD